MLQVLQLLHTNFQGIGFADFAYNLPTSAYKLSTKKAICIQELHDSIYMILYNILYNSSFSTVCKICSFVANVARQNVCLAYARAKLPFSIE